MSWKNFTGWFLVDSNRGMAWQPPYLLLRQGWSFPHFSRTEQATKPAATIILLSLHGHGQANIVSELPTMSLPTYEHASAEGWETPDNYQTWSSPTATSVRQLLE